MGPVAEAENEVLVREVDMIHFITCHRMGRPACTMCLGTLSLASRIIIPNPPQNDTTFICMLFSEPDWAQLLIVAWPPSSSALAGRHRLDGARRQGLFRGLLSALEALIRPHVAPLSVAPAVRDSQIIQVAVDCL